MRNVGPYGNIYLFHHLQKTIALFRLSAAPINRNIIFTKFGTCIANRFCDFCDTYFSNRCVEDEYHVCFECPLYDDIRADFYINLLHSEFDFLKKCTEPLFLLSSILSVSKPKHVRILGDFLYKCLALRSLFNQDESDTFWTTFFAAADRKRFINYLDKINNIDAIFMLKSQFIFQNAFKITLDKPRKLTDFISIVS